MSDLTDLQRQLIDAQAAIIALQQRIDALTPKNAPDDTIFWHIHSGMFSTDAATSDDPAVVRAFRDWLIRFAELHLKPYVHPLVYSETLNQMTRGLGEWIVELEERALREKGRVQ